MNSVLLPGINIADAFTCVYPQFLDDSRTTVFESFSCLEIELLVACLHELLSVHKSCNLACCLISKAVASGKMSAKLSVRVARRCWHPGTVLPNLPGRTDHSDDEKINWGLPHLGPGRAEVQKKINNL